MSEQPYVDVTNRLHVTYTVAAMGIGALTVASVWGRWHAVALALTCQIVMIVANDWITRVFLKRGTVTTVETARLAINLAIFLPQAHFLHWPLPVWLVLPFTALVFDQTHRAVAARAVFLSCAFHTALALYDGVALLYPAVFVGLAAMAWNISRMRDDARKQMATELRQAHKLEAVGRLASGIAHEINTPLQYARDNVRFLEEAMDELVGLVGVYRTIHGRMLEGGSLATLIAEAHRAEAQADLPYLLEHVGEASHDSGEGLDRITAIVASMRQLAHPEQTEMSELDLNKAIENVLIVASHEYRYVADVRTRFAELPPLVCHPGTVSQALLNIVVNAAHAITDAPSRARSGGRGVIGISTGRVVDDLVIEISDTGVGIPEAIRSQVFDPFFTTKVVGRGTGQGLAIARSVAEQHGGTLSFVSQPGEGTTFSLRLPVRGRAVAA